MQKKPSHIKFYLKSKSPETLKVLMLRNNVEKKHYFDYNIIHDGNNWFAWYEWDTDNLNSELPYEENDQG